MNLSQRRYIIVLPLSNIEQQIPIYKDQQIHIKMGACLSSGGGNLDHIDDSVHVMLKHDRKKRKESGTATSAGYKPRAANPALEKKKAEAATPAANVPAAAAAGEEKTEETASGNE